jgi:hypothetical protein
MGRNKFSTGAALALSAVLLTSSTAAVYAVASLPKHSVGKKQLKKFAVTNKKIAPGAVSGSKIAANTVVSASRMAFGKGFATSVPATTVLSLPRLGVTVTTDGTSSTNPSVVVHLPLQTGFRWIVGQDGAAMFSTMGGATGFGPSNAGENSLTANVWRSDNSQAFTLHCVFDIDGFTSARPLSCTALSN